MFAAEAKAVIKQVGAHGDLISNSNLHHKMDLLTLVRVTEGRFWSVPKFKTMECSLPELMDEPDFSPGIEEEMLVKDFTTNVETSGTGNVEGGHGDVGEAKVKGSTDTVDGMASPVSMMKKKANIKTVRTKFNDRKIKKDKLKMLGLKDRDKLLFVHQMVYNTGPVKLIRKSKRDGSISASCQKMLNLLVTGSRKEETSFTVPEKSTFAYGLMEITGLEEETLKISYEPWVAHRCPFGMIINNDASSGENSNVNIQQVKEGVEMKIAALQPLADVPESTRRELLKTLGELLKDGDNLALVEQTLEQYSKGVSECPQSQPVASFMDLLDVSNTSTTLKDAVHLLVSALDTLPDGAAVLLTTCCPEALTVLNQLVDGLIEDKTEVKLPLSLPPPLQEDGELRWAAELLCSTDQTLKELSDQWDSPEFPPGVLLEVLSLVVRGLSLMQP